MTDDGKLSLNISITKPHLPMPGANARHFNFNFQLNNQGTADYQQQGATSWNDQNVDFLMSI